MDKDSKSNGSAIEWFLLESKTGQRFNYRRRYVKIILENIIALKTTIVLIIVIASASCSQSIDYNKYSLNYENVFYEFGNDLEKEKAHLMKTIEENELKIQSNPLYIDYKTSTDEYLEYLDELDSIIINSEYNVFFTSSTPTEENDRFIANSNNYVKNIYNIATDENSRIRINYLLGVEAYLTEDDLHVKYIDWYFKGASEGICRFLIRKRKRDVLIIQNDILYAVLLEQCNNGE